MQNNELGRDVVSAEGLKKEKRCAEEVFILSPIDSMDL